MRLDWTALMAGVQLTGSRRSAPLISPFPSRIFCAKLFSADTTPIPVLATPRTTEKTDVLYSFLITLLFLLLTSCGGGSGSDPNSGQPPAQGSRVLGLDIKSVPLVDYGTAYLQATALGVREVSVSLDWSLLEATEGNYDDTLPDIIDSFYPTQTGDLTLVLRPLDTAGPRLPADLAGRALDDPLVIAAFENFLTHLHDQLPTLNASGKLKWIHVGNEIDAYLGSNSARWTAWQTFFTAAKTQIENLWGSGVIVSSVAQYGALTNNSIRPFYLTLLPDLDSAAFTYYPLNADFTVEALSQVVTDFDFMASTLPGKPIILQECGYPSDTLNNSSEMQQADFISAVFNAWDTHREQINVIDFAWQYDVDEATADQWVIDYGMSGQPNADKFKTYLWTLGLGNNDSTEKQAWQRLRDELQTRSWVH